jgi:signal transduction histidine kinase
LISRIVQDFGNQIDNPNLLLVCQSQEKQEDKNDLTFVRADKSRLIQVISNLLSNAIKFTKEGIISVNVEKHVKEREKDIRQDEAIITIRDVGVGIDSKLLHTLFSKFATKSFAGTGLGLFISKSIVEAHGGRIWAENNSDGRGATFIFTLPLDKSSKLIDVME